MRLKLFLFLATLMTIIQSCQKELLFDTVIIPPPPVVIDSNYISKIYAVDVNGASADTTKILTYNYDNSKRVVSIVDSTKDLYNATQQSYYYFYNNADTLPYKSVLYQVYADDPALTQFTYDTTISFHFYDGSGRNAKDSAISSHQNVFSGYNSKYTIKNFSYGANKVYGFAMTFPISNPGNTYPHQKDTATLDGNGNITDNKKYFYDSFTSTWDLAAISTFTYDNKPSPFSILSNYKTFGLFPSGETFISELPQKNNRVSQREHHSFSGGQPGVHFDFDYTNTYKPNGFLKEIIVYGQPPVPTIYTKASFLYKAL